MTKTITHSELVRGRPASYDKVYLVPRPGKKTIVAINHNAIPDEKTRESLRQRWRKALDTLFTE